MFKNFNFGRKKIFFFIFGISLLTTLLFTNLTSTTQQTDMEKIASAYIQAITNGTGSKSVVISTGIAIDFSTCNRSLIWSNECQRVVYGGMDGKSVFMYALNSSNLTTLLPTENAKKAIITDMFLYLANCNYTFANCNYTVDNGWYTQLASTKTLLRNYLSGLFLQFQQMNYDQIAAAYIQAVTDGTGSKYTYLTDGNLIDFSTCNNALRWGNECQRIVYNGMDGKTIFMNNLNAVNLLNYLPTINAKKAILTDLFLYLANCNGSSGFAACVATPDNGWYSTIQGTKTLLRNYLSQLATYSLSNPLPPITTAPPSPTIFSYFDNILDSAVTSMSIDIQINYFPQYYPSDSLYFWALVVQFSPVINDPTNYWGHIGLQITSSCGAIDSKCANWGGGGNGNGTGDYGIGGSIVNKIPWKVGTTYTYSVIRQSQIPNSQVWLWQGIITDKTTGIQYNLGTIKGGDYIVTDGWRNMYGNATLSNPSVMTETGYGVLCNSATTSVTWSNLKVNNALFKQIKFYPGNCNNTLEKYDAVKNGWTHETNTNRPVGYDPLQILNLK